MAELELDLYKIYKKFYQRSNRNKDNDDLYEMTAIARTIAHKTFIEEIHKNKNEVNKKDTLLLATLLEKLEKEYEGGFDRYFSAELVLAIKNNRYCSRVPHERAHSWLANNNLEGILYLFTSEAKPEQVKLGATYGDPLLRANKYSSKFGYKVDLLTFAEVANPWKAETELSDLLRNKRVSGHTIGDSNEWYFLSSDDARHIFSEFVADYVDRSSS